MIPNSYSFDAVSSGQKILQNQTKNQQNQFASFENGLRFGQHISTYAAASDSATTSTAGGSSFGEDTAAWKMGS